MALIRSVLRVYVACAIAFTVAEAAGMRGSNVEKETLRYNEGASADDAKDSFISPEIPIPMRCNPSCGNNHFCHLGRCLRKIPNKSPCLYDTWCASGNCNGICISGKSNKIEGDYIRKLLQARNGYGNHNRWNKHSLLPFFPTPKPTMKPSPTPKPTNKPTMGPTPKPTIGICSDHSECGGYHFCYQSKCTVKRATGETCFTDDWCQSGDCGGRTNALFRTCNAFSRLLMPVELTLIDELEESLDRLNSKLTAARKKHLEDLTKSELSDVNIKKHEKKEKSSTAAALEQLNNQVEKTRSKVDELLEKTTDSTAAESEEDSSGLRKRMLLQARNGYGNRNRWNKHSLLPFFPTPKPTMKPSPTPKPTNKPTMGPTPKPTIGICSGHSECGGYHFCYQSKCTVKRATGETCFTDDWCLSGDCGGRTNALFRTCNAFSRLLTPVELISIAELEEKVERLRYKLAAARKKREKRKKSSTPVASEGLNNQLDNTRSKVDELLEKTTDSTTAEAEEDSGLRVLISSRIQNALKNLQDDEAKEEQAA